MSDLAIVLQASCAVILIWCGVVAFHLGGAALVQRGWLPRVWAASVLLGPLMAVGLALVLQFLSVRFEGISLPAPFRMGAVCFYLAGCLGYIQIRALLSRGYSLTILIDLLEKAGQGTVLDLKAQYGGGRGLEWMLSKRIGSMALLKMVQLNGQEVGPLTGLGRICARGGHALRRLLRLERVG